PRRARGPRRRRPGDLLVLHPPGRHAQRLLADRRSPGGPVLGGDGRARAGRPVAARAGDAIELTVDGRRELAARLGAGATSSVPRTLRAGIVWYDSLRTHDVVHAVVAATAS